jgi:hypothetical protein
LLLEHGVEIVLLLKGPKGAMAYGRMGGYEPEDDGPAARCIIGHGATSEEAARALIDGPLHPNIKTSAWRLGEACDLLTGEYRGR